MHQNAFGGRVPPGPAGGAHGAPPDLVAVFGEGGPPERGGEWGGEREGRRGEGKEKGGGKRNGKEGEGREGNVPLQFIPVPPNFLIPCVAPV